jgi:hypothetical protein
MVVHIPIDNQNDSYDDPEANSFHSDFLSYNKPASSIRTPIKLTSHARLRIYGMPNA